MDTREHNEDEIEYSDIEEEDNGSFRVPGTLKAPEALTMTMKEMHRWIHHGIIELNPPWQRDVVWNEARQSKLIVSIYQNYWIPPVVFAVEKDDEGDDVYVCVDGKQRLTSIQKFIDGQIPYIDPRTKKKWWYTLSNSKKQSSLEIPLEYRNLFDSKVLTYIQYTNLPNGSERELFQRVQLGVTLTSAEKLQAIHSEWASWITRLVEQHVLVSGGLQDVLKWQTARSRDYLCIAQVVFCCHQIHDKPFPSINKLTEWMKRTDRPNQQLKDDINEVLRSFWSIATNKRLSHGFEKVKHVLAPAEFVFIGALLYLMREDTIENCADAIYHLRVGIREAFPEAIRMRTDIGATFWRYMDILKDNPCEPLTKQSKKRKRKSNVKDDDYDDNEPKPSRGRGRTRAK